MARNKTQRTKAEIETALTGALARISDLERQLKRSEAGQQRSAAVRYAREAARDEVEKRMPTTGAKHAEKVEARRLERRENVIPVDRPDTAPTRSEGDSYAIAYAEYRRELLPTLRLMYGGRAWEEGAPETERQLDKLMARHPQYAYKLPRNQTEADALAEAEEERERQEARTKAEREDLPSGHWRDPFGLERGRDGRPVPSEAQAAIEQAERERFQRKMREDNAAVNQRMYDPVELKRMRDAGEISKAPADDVEVDPISAAIERQRKKLRAIQNRIAKKAAAANASDGNSGLTPEDHHERRKAKVRKKQAELKAGARARQNAARAAIGAR